MKVSQRLYEKALPIWESYFTHPFIQGMADGTLAKDKFQFYMIQKIQQSTGTERVQ